MEKLYKPQNRKSVALNNLLVYKSASVDKEVCTPISEQELQENSMTIEESKRLMLERIYRDFHK